MANSQGAAGIPSDSLDKLTLVRVGPSVYINADIVILGSKKSGRLCRTNFRTGFRQVNWMLLTLI